MIKVPCEYWTSVSREGVAVGVCNHPDQPVGTDTPSLESCLTQCPHGPRLNRAAVGKMQDAAEAQARANRVTLPRRVALTIGHAAPDELRDRLAAIHDEPEVPA